jgi:hypothetical protein
MHWTRIVLMMIFFLAMTATAAEAHSPIFLTPVPTEGVQQRPPIDNPEKSWAIYGRLGPGEAVDVIPVQGWAGRRLKLQVLVPRRDDLAEYRPELVLIGPGLTGQVPPGFPVRPGEGEGALVVPTPNEPRVFDEEFTKTSYRVWGEYDGKFPATGTYRLAVWDPAGKGGTYTAALGFKEQFGIRDLFRFPRIRREVQQWVKQ